MRYFIVCLAVICPTLFAQPATTFPARQSKYPPKTARTLFTDEQIAMARVNVKKYPAAGAIAANIIKAADGWMAWKDEELTFALTSAEVPRAFAVSVSGCPVCGAKMKEAHGDYGWIMDPKKPFKLICPSCGTQFPSNDYTSYYRSGFKTKNDGDKKYVDDGWGWVDPKTGEKFWFVAYYNHWLWHKYLVPGLHDLAEAYLLTGDKQYAHKAAVMLHRIAEVYPAMDHAKQSRYGQMMAARGIDYPGKVVNAIWETSLAQSVCDSYDGVFDTIDSDTELLKETNKTGPQIRSFIDANFLEDAIDAYFQKKIRGNFGMHQSCLTHLAIVRQTGDSKKWLDGLMNNTEGSNSMLGLNYALYDLVYRDGEPSETSPGYNFLWVNKIASYGDLLQRAGVDVFGIPKTKRLFDAVIDQVNAGEFTPDLGDAGGYQGYLEGKDANAFQVAYSHYKDPRYAAWLAKIGASGDGGFKSFESLFKPAIEVPAGAKLPPAKSRLLDGYGLAIVNDPADKISMSMYYGQKHGHGHYDRLNFELFANGVPIMPDLGYPDAMNDFVPGIYTWSKNTISHNTVVVDAKRQIENVPGEVKLFADSSWARCVDVEAAGTYPQCKSYRRAMIMVDAGPNQSYFVDIFTVKGGSEHDYSLHGPPGEFEMIGGKWSAPAKGTLAGENVALGEIYDDPARAKKTAKTTYSDYQGSGFQHLFNVQTYEGGGDWIAQFKDVKDPHAMLRIRTLDQPGQKMMLADAHISPAKYPQIVKYLIARRQGKDLASRFVSVIEPFKSQPFIKHVEWTTSPQGDCVELIIATSDGTTDVIGYNPDGVNMRTNALNTPANVAIDRYTGGKSDSSWLRIFGTTDPNGASPTTRLAGTVVESLPLQSAVVVQLTPSRQFDPQSLVGRVVFFKNARHRTAHTVTSVTAGGDTLVLKLADELLVGLAKVDAVDGTTISTSVGLPLAPTYRGTTLCDELFRISAPVESVSEGKIHLVKPLPRDQKLKLGDKVWLLDVGVGDTIEVPLVRFSNAATTKGVR